MMFLVNKETRLNLRITPEFRSELELLADYHGLRLSSYVHSLLVKAVRKEKMQDYGIDATEITLTTPKQKAKTGS